MMRLVYGVLTRVAAPAVFAATLVRAAKDPAYRTHLGERFGLGRRLAKPSIWLHAVSVGEVSAAAALVRALHARHPESIDAVKGLAETALKLNQPEQALRYHQILIEKGEATPQVLYNSGVLAHQLNDPAAAAALYRGALEAQPDFPEALLNLGHALEALGQTEDARESWIKALGVKPELANDYFLPRPVES